MIVKMSKKIEGQKKEWEETEGCRSDKNDDKRDKCWKKYCEVFPRLKK